MLDNIMSLKISGPSFTINTIKGFLVKLFACKYNLDIKVDISLMTY